MHRHVCSNDGGDGDCSQGRRWACPFYLSNPIRHETCMAYKLGRVPDVRQHIERKHADETGEGEIEKMKRKNDRGSTNVERWYALWTLFFPGRARPATPYYTGTGFADLSVAFMSRFMEEWEKNGIPGDVKMALTGYMAFVRTTSLEMKSGRMTIQPVADVSEHQPQGPGIQGSNHYQGLTLFPNPPGPMVMSQPQQPDPRGFFPGYHDTQAPNVQTQGQAPAMPVANGQYWPRPADATAYPAVPAHQLAPVSSWYTAAATGLVDYAIDSSDLSRTIDWASGVTLTESDRMTRFL